MPEVRPTVIRQLMDLREITRLTGTVDELQAKNLKAWGRIVFTREFYLTWDGEKRVVEYTIGLDGVAMAIPDNWDKMLEALNTSIKELLGFEWLLSVKDGQKVIFTGPRKLSFKPVQDEPLVPPRGEPDVK